MSYEITQKDSVLLYKNEAWHGLGTVIPEKLSADAALEKSGLGWEVGFGEEEISVIGGKKFTQDRYKTLWRLGSHPTALSNFTCAYEPIQNKTLFDLGQTIIDLASKEGGEKMFMESCGSIQEGRKVWLLLNQKSRQINEKDEVRKYVAIAHSHDGTLCLGVRPTSIRIVCSNTLSMAFNKKKGNYITIAHKGCVGSKIEAARGVLRQYFDVTADFDEKAKRLMDKKVSMESAAAFIAMEWRQLFPNKKSEDFYKEYTVRSIEVYERELETLEYKELNWWLVANAVTNVLQNEAASKENRVYGKILGRNLTRSDRVFADALKLSV